MRLPSRYMPKYKVDEKSQWIGWIFIALFLGWIAYGIWDSPKIGLSLLALFIILGFISTYYDNKRLKKLALDRKDENIGTFARSFEYRKVDTWVIRAVYEELCAYMTFKDGFCPPKSSDLLMDILQGEWDDVDDIIVTTLQRTNRTEKDIEKNPYYDKIETVKDLVLFLDAQPKSENADNF